MSEGIEPLARARKFGRAGRADAALARVAVSASRFRLRGAPLASPAPSVDGRTAKRPARSLWATCPERVEKKVNSRTATMKWVNGSDTTGFMVAVRL